MSFFYFPEQVNDRAARLVAGVVALSLAVAIPLELRFVVPLIAIGFWLRLGFGPRVSPLARIAVRVAAARWPAVLVPGAPKRFAQGIGAVFTTTASALLFSGLPLWGWSIAGVIVLCAAIEATQAFCVGCWMYGRLGPIGALLSGARSRKVPLPK
ncbi:MAG: DUF4395 domain-containing protein [Deltaproteobacteria bacterium]|nr:DUF4395 domain-containing protein [Deltaproteobacteria bacterium]